MRKAAIAAALSLTLSSLLLADWPGYRGPATDGAAAIQTPPASLANLKQLWRIPLGDSFGQIAITGDRAVVFTMRGADEFVTALDTKTGKELWPAGGTRIDKSIRDQSGGPGPRSTPRIDGNLIFVQSTYQKLACLELATGKIVWLHDLITEYHGPAKAQGVGMWGGAASPITTDDLVITVGGGPGKGIIAFHKATGEFAWGATDDNLTQASPTLATILGQKQIIAFMASGLISVDAAKGTILWTLPHKINTATAASAVVGGQNGDIVYCSTGYNVGAEAARISKNGDTWSAKQLWATKGKNMNLWSTPVYYNGCIYGLFNHNDPSGPLACLDIETGNTRWSKPGFGSHGGITRLGDKLLIQDTKGELVLVAANPDAYTELSRIPQFKGKNWIAPAYSDGLLFARSTTEAACFDLGTK